MKDRRFLNSIYRLMRQKKGFNGRRTISDGSCSSATTKFHVVVLKRYSAEKLTSKEVYPGITTVIPSVLSFLAWAQTMRLRAECPFAASDDDIVVLDLRHSKVVGIHLRVEPCHASAWRVFRRWKSLEDESTEQSI